MTVTVCIPVWNDTTYLTGALNSVSVQTTRPGEVIIVDDGSDVPLPRFPVERVGDYFCTIRTTHRGPGSAWNTGLMNAKGDWFLPLASDDWLEPDFLAQCLGAAYPPLCAIDHQPPDVVVPSMQEHGGQNTRYTPHVVSLEEEMAGHSFPYCALYRTEFLRGLGGWDARLMLYPDWAMWVNLLQVGARMAFAPQATVNYRRHEGQHSARISDEEHHAECARVRELYGG